MSRTFPRAAGWMVIGLSIRSSGPLGAWCSRVRVPGPGCGGCGLLRRARRLAVIVRERRGERGCPACRMTGRRRLPTTGVTCESGRRGRCLERPGEEGVRGVQPVQRDRQDEHPCRPPVHLLMAVSYTHLTLPTNREV